MVMCLCLLAGGAAAQEIERMEPPFWWTGFQHRELQLLVHGNNVSLMTPVVDKQGVAVNRIVRVASPNYLFLYLTIDPDAEPGVFDIVFREGDYTLTHGYELRPRNPEHGRGVTPADAIYLVTPDRFANGDPGNDEFGFLDDKLDRSEPYGRHGGDLRGVADSLGYIAEMGFTAVCLNPVLENAVPVWSYEGHAITDFYSVDPRLGSNEQLRELADSMRTRGLGLIMDLVLNHIGSGHWWMDDLPAHDWLNSPDGSVTSNHRRTINTDPNASDFDRRQFTDGWFSESAPDLNQRNPLVADYLAQNSIWWIEFAGLQGIRVDKLPYQDRQFTARWSRRLLREYPAFSIIGEEWNESPPVVAYWQQASDGSGASLPHLSDFPLRAALSRALTGDPSYWDGVWISLYETLGMDFLYADPAQLVISADGQDVDRIFTQLGEDPDLNRMAMVFLATMRGIPQFYYGTEVLASHPDGSSQGEIRSDFPGGWDGDSRNAFTGEGLTETELQAQALVQGLLNWRKSSTAIHAGDFMHYVPLRNVYVYFRFDATETIMVILNRDEEPVTLETDRFSERIGEATHASNVLDGTRYDISDSVLLEPRSALVLRIEKPAE
jgi:glycosidase